MTTMHCNTHFAQSIAATSASSFRNTRRPSAFPSAPRSASTSFACTLCTVYSEKLARSGCRILREPPQTRSNPAQHHRPHALLGRHHVRRGFHSIRSHGGRARLLCQRRGVALGGRDRKGSVRDKRPGSLEPRTRLCPLQRIRPVRLQNRNVLPSAAQRGAPGTLQGHQAHGAAAQLGVRERK